MHAADPLPRGRSLGDLPLEIKVHVARMVYLMGQPASGTRTLHVLLPRVQGAGDPVEHGSLGALEEATASRRLLWKLCQVSHTWHASARPFLFRAVHVGLPHSFILLLRSLGASFLVSAYDAAGDPHTVNADPTDPASFPRMVAAAGFAHATGHRMVVSLPRKKPMRPPPTPNSARVTVPKGRSPLKPLPQFASSSTDEFSFASDPPFPVRGRLLPDNEGELELVWEEDELLSEATATDTATDTATETDATEDATETESEIESVVRRRRKTQRYVVSLREDETLRQTHRFVRVLDFSTFRTQGLRRTVGDGEVARFVTPARLLALITSVRDSLTIFGASENMDSALTLPVLESLLFRPNQSTPGTDRSRRRPPWTTSASWDDLPTRTSSRGKTFQRRTASLRGVSLKAMRERKSNALEVRATLQDANPPIQRKQLKALDLCGCVSSAFQVAILAFVERHLTRPSDRAERMDRPSSRAERRGRSRTRELVADDLTEESGTESDHRVRVASQPAPLLSRSVTMDSAPSTGRMRTTRASSLFERPGSLSRSSLRGHARTRSNPSGRPEWKPAQFPHVKRLGLSGARAHAPALETFVMAFPSLTHLDLSRTMVTDTLLAALAVSGTRLRSLGLAECPLLSSRGITDLLLSEACADLTELSVRRTTDGPALTYGDAEQLLRLAPCLRRGQMRYLDLGGCGMEDDLLHLLPAQPYLLDLGLSFSPHLSLPALADWILFRGRAIEVLDLAFSGHSPHGPMTATTLYTLLLRPLAEAPQPSLAEQLAGLGRDPPPREAATNLQCVGLAPAALHTVGGGIGAWRAIRGAGRRGWIIDTLAETVVNPEVEQTWVFTGVPPPAPACPRSDVEDVSDSPDAPEMDTAIAPRSHVLRGLPPSHPRAQALRALANNQFNVASVGWHSHKSDILHGLGFLGRESGSYAHVAFART